MTSITAATSAATIATVTTTSASTTEVRQRRRVRHEPSSFEQEDAKREREARSVAIEKAYVHDVYEQMSQYISDSRHRTWPRVKQFLEDLEDGSLVCDVGCGNGKYLDVNPNIFVIGSDRCRSLAQIAREKDQEVLHCDNLSLPFRDEGLDAVLSIAVIHHVATTERRIRAIKELSRVLRVGGRLMISVWAMEQRHRKFESQDVLIPWHKPIPPTSTPPPPTPPQSLPPASSKHPGSGLSTCTTSEDDVTHYHAYSQASDSGEWYTQGSRFRRRHRNKGRSIDSSGLAAEGFFARQSSSDLSSPNESCYSFVRKAIQKFSSSKRHQSGFYGSFEDSSMSRFPWFTFVDPSSSLNQEAAGGEKTTDDDSHKGDSVGESLDDLPIELRHLEFINRDDEDCRCHCCSSSSSSSSSSVRRNAASHDGNNMATTAKTLLKDLKNSFSASLKSFDSSIKSGSLTSLSSGTSFSVKSDSGLVYGHHHEQQQEQQKPKDNSSSSNNNSSSSNAEPTLENPPPPPRLVRLRALSDPIENITASVSSSSSSLSNQSDTPVECTMPMKVIKEVNESDLSENNTPINSPGDLLQKIKRPTLVKQKPSFYFPDIAVETAPHSTSLSVDYDSDKTPRVEEEEEDAEEAGEEGEEEGVQEREEVKGKQEVEEENGNNKNAEKVETADKEIKIIPEVKVKQVSFEDLKEEVKSMPFLGPPQSSVQLPLKGILKQTSMNDEWFSHERVEANYKVRKGIPKQHSLPEDRVKRKIPSLKESVFTRFESIRNSMSILRPLEEEEQKRHRLRPDSGAGLRKGFVRIFSNWNTASDDPGKATYSVDDPSFTLKRGVSIQPLDVRGMDSATRRSLFQRRRGPTSTSATTATSPQQLSPQQLVEALTKENVENLSPTFRRCCLDCGGASGGDLVVLEKERKLSRGDNTSDSSSKDGSIQSDTSLDSEDSCVSVIFIPPTSATAAAVAAAEIMKKQASNSSESSESGKVSPLSPANRLNSPKLSSKMDHASVSSASSSCSTTTSSLMTTSTSHSTTDAIIVMEPTRVLEKIEERHSESEEAEEQGPEEKTELPKVENFPVFLEKKSFEMEDIPDEMGIQEYPRQHQRIKTKRRRNRFDYPIVRHHPLFAKQPKTGSNFSSLLAGKDIRVIRRRQIGKLFNFEIFNPEVDDLDSDSSDNNSSSSVESVVSARVGKPPTVIITTDEGSDKEEEEEEEDNDNDDADNDDDNDDDEDDDDDDDDVSTPIEEVKAEFEDRAASTDSGGEICSELSARSEKRRQGLLDLLDENLVVLNSITSSNVASSVTAPSYRRSKVDLSHKLDICFESKEEADTPATPSTKRFLFKTQSLDNDIPKPSLGGSWITRSVELAPTDDEDEKNKDETSNLVIQQFSSCCCCSSSESNSDIAPKSPSPSRSEHSIQSEPPVQSRPKRTWMRSTSMIADDRKKPSTSAERKKLELEDFLMEESESTNIPYRRLEHQQQKMIRPFREDSVESSSTSAKSSVQYGSDTSSLLSHRFSTISISSNVSSDVSFGNTSSVVSGSSCYLASMSSADFDDRPGLVSSFSLSEAEENEYLQRKQQQQEIRSEARLRLLTETSIETSIENPAYVDQETFEEELFREISKDDDDDDDDDDDVILGPASSNESLQSSDANNNNSQQQQQQQQQTTQHRYYHVFKEGELDHLINTYVENLHIINSYYDHANWCIVAEKVNVWTI